MCTTISLIFILKIEQNSLKQQISDVLLSLREGRGCIAHSRISAFIASEKSVTLSLTCCYANSSFLKTLQASLRIIL